MIRTLLAGLAILATPATAQNAEIEAVLSQALDEQHLMQTCSATLGPDTQELFVSFYADQAVEVIELLDSVDYTSPQVDELRVIAETGMRRSPDDTPFGDIVAYCTENPDWVPRMSRFELFNPIDAIRQIGERP